MEAERLFLFSVGGIFTSLHEGISWPQVIIKIIYPLQTSVGNHMVGNTFISHAAPALQIIFLFVLCLSAENKSSSMFSRLGNRLAATFWVPVETGRQGRSQHPQTQEGVPLP